MDENTHIALDAEGLAKACDGQWLGLANPGQYFSAVTPLGKAEPGAICFAYDRSMHWRKAGVGESQERDFHAAISAGASAFIVGRGCYRPQGWPILEVESTWQALRLISCNNREMTGATRIFVTGSVGKTNYKLMVRHTFSRQVQVHAVPDSSNLNMAIWSSLASIRNGDEIAVLEASVANPHRGRQRSAFVKPHICVFTNISPSHTGYHGSIENLIRNKAESIIGLLPGGICLMSADHPYFLSLKQEVQRLRAVPVMTWGEAEHCDARLLDSTFDAQQRSWQVSALVLGRRYDFTIGSYHSFAPRASLGVLLTAAVTDLDVDEVAASLADFSMGETAGRILEIPMTEGPFTLFDYSQRGSIEGFRAALADLYRLTPEDRRIILALGECRDLAESDNQQVHREIAQLIQTARTEKIFTVGDGMLITRRHISDPDRLASHGDTPADIARELLASIQPGDVLFIQGHHRVWMSNLVKAIDKRWPRQANKTAQQAPRAPAKRYRLLAGGDLMLARDLPGRLFEEGSDWVFGPLLERIRQADGLLANLECVISTHGDFVAKSGEKRPFHYRAPAAVTELLTRLCPTTLITANNHSMDYGEQALLEQLQLLDRLGIGHTGAGPDQAAAESFQIQRVGDVTVAIIGFETTAPWAAAGASRGGIFHLRHSPDAIERLAPIIAKARRYAHVVIASPHWGNNWAERPGKTTRKLAHALIDAGADAVLGHSAHILQGIEIYRGRAIAYDMGTLLFDRVGQGRMRDAALFELELSRAGIHSLSIVPLRLARCRARIAQGADARRVIDLMVRLSSALSNENTPSMMVDGRLHLPLVTGSLHHSPEPPPVGTRLLDRPAGKVVTAITESAPPPLTPAGEVVVLGNGLELGGVYHPERVAPGYAFVFELRFRCRTTQSQRWRAELRFISEDGTLASAYRYPVADGIWHSSLAGSARWFADRILVRTPTELHPGGYRLYWNLWSRDEAGERFYWSDSWVAVGRLAITTDAEEGVAGLGPGHDRQFHNVQAVRLD